jgi:hypothetical protein
MLAWQLKENTDEATLQMQMQMQKMPFCCQAFVFGCICPFSPKRTHLRQRRIPPFVS